MGEAKRRQAVGPYHWELSRISGATLGLMIASRHPEAFAYLELILRVSAWMHDKTRKPALCITCDYAFGHDELPAKFIVCKPAVAKGGDLAICKALCGKCARYPDILERITAVYRKSVFKNDQMTVVGFTNLGLDERVQ
jgi:hypothetical protein